MIVLVVGIALTAFGVWSYREWRIAEHWTQLEVEAREAGRDSDIRGGPPRRGDVDPEVLKLPARQLGYASPVAIGIGAICTVVGLFKILADLVG